MRSSGPPSPYPQAFPQFSTSCNRGERLTGPPGLRAEAGAPLAPDARVFDLEEFHQNQSGTGIAPSDPDLQMTETFEVIQRRNQCLCNEPDRPEDINGYFAAPGSAGELLFYSVNRCRIADTRNPGRWLF